MKSTFNIRSIVNDGSFGGSGGCNMVGSGDMIGAAHEGPFFADVTLRRRFVFCHRSCELIRVVGTRLEEGAERLGRSLIDVPGIASQREYLLGGHKLVSHIFPF